MAHLRQFWALGLALFARARYLQCTPNGSRTRVSAVRGRCPGPLDDGGQCRWGNCFAYCQPYHVTQGALFRCNVRWGKGLRLFCCTFVICSWGISRRQ